MIAIGTFLVNVGRLWAAISRGSWDLTFDSTFEGPGQ